MILFILLFLPIVFSMRNPAAVFCKQMGYEYKIVDTPEGQIGKCILPDGSEVDEWEFFKGNVKREYHYCSLHGYDVVYIDDVHAQITPKGIKSGVFCKPKKTVKGKAPELIDVVDMMHLNLSGGFAEPNLTVIKPEKPRITKPKPFFTRLFFKMRYIFNKIFGK